MRSGKVTSDTCRIAGGTVRACSWDLGVGLVLSSEGFPAEEKEGVYIGISLGGAAIPLSSRALTEGGFDSVESSEGVRRVEV